MIILFYRYLCGYLTVEIHGNSCERFINMCMHHNIKLWHLDISKGVYSFQILRTDFKKLKVFSRKTEVKVRIIERIGIPFFLFRHRKRKMFGIGFLICIVSIILMTQFIWDIEISGNQYYTDEMIVSILNENHIQITMLSKDIDCDEIVSLLRADCENITWVSVHIDGCKLIITIKENDQLDEEDLAISQNISAYTANTVNTVVEDEESGIDIVAQESGTVYSIITLTGTPQVHVGDEVSAGDILVTGCLELYNDSQEIIGYHYVESSAVIYIETEYTYYNMIDKNYMNKVYTDNIIEKEYVRIGNYYLEALKLSSLEKLYDITRIETSLLSEQQNTWSLCIGTATYQEYEWLESIYTENELQYILTDTFTVYCDELMQKGVEILENDVNIYIDEKNATAKGTLQVIVKNDKTMETQLRELSSVVAEEGMTE